MKEVPEIQHGQATVATVFLLGLGAIVSSIGLEARAEQRLNMRLGPSWPTPLNAPPPEFPCAGPSCPWNSATGNGIVTVARSPEFGCQAFSIIDPLPGGSVVTEIDVDVALAPFIDNLGQSLSVRWNGTVIGTSPLPAMQTLCTPPPGTTMSFEFVNVTGIESDQGLTFYNHGTENVLTIVPLQLIELVDVTLHYRPPPGVNFEITSSTSDDDRKVIIQKVRSEDTFPSQYQRRLPGQDSDRNRRIDIRGTVFDGNGNPVAGQTIYLRVMDPPDVAPYANASSAAGDNGDKSGPFANGASLSNTQVRSDATGAIDTVLTVSDHVSGDNYRVEASTIAGFGGNASCNRQNNCYQTGVITAWKRVYLEQDRMFRVGTNLREFASAGSDRVRVMSGRGLQVGSRVVFIHAPDHLSAGGPFYMEPHTIQAIRGRRHPFLVLDSPLVNDYTVETSPVDANNDVLADAVGLISGGDAPSPSDLYDSVNMYIKPLFDSTFIDVLPLDCTAIPVCDPVPYIPHYDVIPFESVYAALAEKWANTRTTTQQNPNHLHLLIGAATAQQNGQIFMGSTAIDEFGGPPFSWIWDDTIQTAAGMLGTNRTNFAGETLVHELAHQWAVNPPVAITGGHCMLQSWDNMGDCLMHDPVTADRGNGHVAFHDYSDPTSEYKRIRRRADPLPQTSFP